MAAHPGEITDLSDKREDAPVAKVARAEAAVDHLREVVAAEPAPVDEDAVRVGTAYEAADSIHRAQRALAEIEARTTAEAVQEAEYSRAAAGPLARCRCAVRRGRAARPCVRRRPVSPRSARRDVLAHRYGVFVAKRPRSTPASPGAACDR
jgi:hypothetical protein